MKKLLGALLLLPALAFAQATDQFGRTVTCTGTAPVTCSTPDGISVSSATQASASTTINGMAPAGWAPPFVPATTLSVSGFIARFSPAEQTAIAGNPATLTFWLTLVAYPSIDVTDPRLVGGMAALVAANAITTARAAQIINLAIASP